MSGWKTGMVTIWSFGKKIAKSTNTNPRTAAKLNIDLLENLEPKTLQLIFLLTLRTNMFLHSSSSGSINL